MFTKNLLLHHPKGMENYANIVDNTTIPHSPYYNMHSEKRLIFSISDGTFQHRIYLGNSTIGT